jgi:predicted dehydrogenase
MGMGAINVALSAEGVTGVVGVDIDPERLAAVKKRYGDRVTVTEDLAMALADEEVRLAFVTASNAAHKELAIRAIEAGKAVLCEKPMATNLADAEAMVACAEARGAFLQIGFELRYSKLYTTVKEWVDADLLGQVVNTSCNYICSEFHHKGSWRNKLETGGSMFGEKLCHYVDLPRWWIGSEVTDVFSACAPNVVPYYEVRDNYLTTYRFANGAVSHLTFIMYLGQTFAGDPLQNVIDQQLGDGHELRYLIAGTRGAAETDVFRRRIKRWEFGDSPKCMTSKLVEERTWDPKEDGRHFHDVGTQNRDVIRRVQAGLSPMTSARDSLETMKLVYAADRSADEGRVVRLDELC